MAPFPCPIALFKSRSVRNLGGDNLPVLFVGMLLKFAMSEALVGADHKILAALLQIPIAFRMLDVPTRGGAGNGDGVSFTIIASKPW